MLDLLLRGGRVIDADNGINGKFDIGIYDGKVVSIEQSIDLKEARKVVDVTDKVVVPGIIDMHVHIGFVEQGRNAMAMLARAGTVTAIDMGGPLDESLGIALTSGAGLNIVCLQMVKPGWNFSSTNPDRKEIVNVIDKAIEDGAFGIKILGGHYPLSPQSTRLIMEEVNKKKLYVALHAGTTKLGPANLNTFKEAVELATSLSVHMAHINTYCRGQILGDPIIECLEVFRLLDANHNIFGESYLAGFSGSPGKCHDGRLDSIGIANSLSMGGYSQDEQGLRKAILDGFASVTCELGEENVLITGKEGLEYWESLLGDVTITCPVVPKATTFLTATQKNKQGRFYVDAISTDGGRIPRNFIVAKGTALIKYGALTWEDFVNKTSSNPAKILGFHEKGHLASGADADITVIDYSKGKAYATINGGQIVMLDGVVLGKGTQIITTNYGAKKVKQRGLEARVEDIQKGWFYKGRPAKK